MKKVIFFLLVLTGVNRVLAQQSVPKFTISLNGGASILTGNFAKGDYADETSGCQKLAA